MAGLFALSVSPKIYKGNFSEDLFLGTFYQQHLGEGYAGLSTFNQGGLKTCTKKGFFRPAFARDIKDFGGSEGIGYCGLEKEPFLVDSRLGEFSTCFSGNITNRFELAERFKNLGHSFSKRNKNDIEVISKLVAQGNGIVQGIKSMTREIQGAYSLLILTKEGIYATRSSDGHWPQVLAEKEGALAVASDSGGLPNIGFKRVRDLEPGEIILMKDGLWESKDKTGSDRIQFCSFFWVYSAFPSAVFEGIVASHVRKKLGAALAKRDIAQGFVPDIVAPVPDSGRFHAIGYLEEFCRQMNTRAIKKVPLYDELLLKYPYATRSFTKGTQVARDLEAKIKLLSSGEGYKGKSVVICDDSIVRGTQVRANLIPKLRSLGVTEIHLRISNPELCSHCPWGKTTKKGEVLAQRFPSNQEKIKFLGVESLEYNRIEDLIGAIGLPRENLCVDCGLRPKV